MSILHDKKPSLDYDELKRRHEAYKKRERIARQQQVSQNPAAQRPTPRPAEPAETETVTEAEEVLPVEPVVEDAQSPDTANDAVQPTQADDAPAGDDAETIDADDAPDEADEDGEDYDDADGEDYGDEDEEDYGDEDGDGLDADNRSYNPFHSFVSMFSGLRERFGHRKDDRDGEEYDDEYDEDEGEAAADAADAGQPDAADADAPDRRELTRWQPAASVDAPVDAQPEDIVDDQDDGWRPAAPVRRGGGADRLEDDDAGLDDDEDFKENGRKAPLSVFQKFLRLFIVPVDEDEDEFDDDLNDGGENREIYDDPDANVYRPRRRVGFSNRQGTLSGPTDVETKLNPDDIYIAPDANQTGPRHSRKAVEAIEGGLDMAELNNLNPEMTDALAADSDSTGLTRRERRERAARMAAAQAKEAQSAQGEDESAEAASEVVDLFSEPPLEADVIDDVADGIVSAKKVGNEELPAADEPTREYKLNSLSALKHDTPIMKDDDEDDDEDAPRRRRLFGFGRRAADDDEDDDEDEDDDDEDDEDEVKQPRRKLFGRRAAKHDDEDDEDEDEDDDEDEEDEVKPPRRKLFSRRSSKYDDEDDEDDDEDEDDEDEEYEDRRHSHHRRHYDEDDEDDEDDLFDDYDDYDDDDDDDDEGSGFGYALLGVLKGFLTAVVVVLVVVVVLNLLDVFNIVPLDNVAQRMPTRAVSLLLPSQSYKHNSAARTPAPIAQPQAQIPNNPGDFDDGMGLDGDDFDEDAGFDMSGMGETWEEPSDTAQAVG